MADKDNAEYCAPVESYVVRLAPKARAAGIYFFLIRTALKGRAAQVDEG